jgi:Holliday junction resolvase RusA-like endonuclease
VTKWYFPLVKGRKDGDFKDTRPDCDNIIKLLKDCMTDLGFWRDDAQVVSETTEKFYANSPGIWVRVEAVHKTAQNITVEEKR